MNKRKYEILKNEIIEHSGIKLYRIRALKDFGYIKKGDKGGYIEKETNLSQEGEAWVFGNAWVFGEARVYENARVSGKAHIKYGKLKIDIFKNLQEYIVCSLNIYPIHNKYILYKRVNKLRDGEYRSNYETSFIYKDNEISEVKDFDPDKKVSCGEGIHISMPDYWIEGDTLIAVEVNVDDIITCQEGKLRVKKVKTLGEIKND